MASPVTKSTVSRRVFWVSIARIFLVEVLILIVLSGAIAGYLNWSSEVAFSEFLAASQQAAGAKPVSHAWIRCPMPVNVGPDDREDDETLKQVHGRASNAVC